MLAGCKNVGTMHKVKIKQIEKETLIIVFFLILSNRKAYKVLTDVK